jgi:hypothetical protein
MINDLVHRHNILAVVDKSVKEYSDKHPDMQKHVDGLLYSIINAVHDVDCQFDLDELLKYLREMENHQLKKAVDCYGMGFEFASTVAKHKADGIQLAVDHIEEVMQDAGD